MDADLFQRTAEVEADADYVSIKGDVRTRTNQEFAEAMARKYVYVPDYDLPDDPMEAAVKYMKLTGPCRRGRTRGV